MSAADGGVDLTDPRVHELWLTDTIDELDDAVDEVKSEAAEVEEEYDELQQRAADGDDVGAELRELDERWDALEASYDHLTSRRAALQAKVDEWGEDARFVVKELTYGELMRAKDEVQNASYELNEVTGEYEGVPRDGYYRVEVLQLAVLQTPQGCPNDPKELGFHVGDWLWNKVDDLNTTPGTDLGNSSLREALEEENESPPNSSDEDSTQTE